MKAAGDLTGSKIPNKITKVSKILETVTNDVENIVYAKEIPKERYKSPEKRENYWQRKINIIV